MFFKFSNLTWLFSTLVHNWHCSTIPHVLNDDMPNTDRKLTNFGYFRGKSMGFLRIRQITTSHNSGQNRRPASLYAVQLIVRCCFRNLWIQKITGTANIMVRFRVHNLRYSLYRKTREITLQEKIVTTVGKCFVMVLFISEKKMLSALFTHLNLAVKSFPWEWI